MEEVKANSVYDLLVKIGGASESERSSFIYHHTSKEGCDEWRFCGKLGYGGKYRSKANRVDCYKEDDTPERMEIIKELNNLLNKLV